MKLGIDSYSFHRYFGEVYEGLQTDPGISWSMLEDFVPYAIEQGVAEVALETLFYDAFDDGLCRELASALDAAGIERVIGWGHPDGLHAGSDHEELEALIRMIPRAPAVGAKVMRIVSGSMIHVNEPHAPQVQNSIKMLKRAAQAAEAEGVTIALENHIDFTSQEIMEIVEGVGSEFLKVNFDTGNALRLFEDPVEAAARLAPYTVSTHTKDITVDGSRGTPLERFTFWPSAPAGQGIIDMIGVIRALRDGGFDGGLGIELDLIAPQFADRPETELVAESLTFLRSALAEIEG